MSRAHRTHRVSFYSPSTTTDTSGQKSVTYTLEWIERCDVLVLSSRKAPEYDMIQTGSDVVQIHMCYTDRVKPDWRVVWNSSTWDVRTVRDRDGRRRILEVTAERYEQ